MLSLFIALVCVAPSVRGLEWQMGAGFRSAALPVPAQGQAGFKQLSPEATGIFFTNRLAQERSLTNQIYLNGSGVAAGDIDGDGWCDLYFCGLDGGNALYRNLGNWKFEDVTDAAGVRCAGLDSSGAVLADIDGDGDLDLLVNTVGHGVHCFLNDGKGHFTEITTSAGLTSQHGGTSLALADIDGDGFLDLYSANYRTSTLRDMPNTRFRIQIVDGKQVVALVNGRPVSEPDLAGRYTVGANGGIEENGEDDVLYRNRGGTNFVAVKFTDGTFLDEDGQPLKSPLYEWGLSVMMRDLNQDGFPDIYVCNDFAAPDRIWLNDGRGHFRALPRLALRKTSLFSMGIDVADINRDGFDDFFLADMLSREHARRHTQVGDIKPPALGIGEIDTRPQYMRNTLFLNRGDGTYAELANLSGVWGSEWSWTPVFLDVDLDGYEDLLITNGHERDAQNFDIASRLEAMKRQRQVPPLEQLMARKAFPRLDTAKVAFRNRGDLTFEDVSHAWGFDARSVSHGMALADLDNDGDLDVVMNNLNGVAGIFRNETAVPRVAVRLKGASPNTHGISAKIKIFGGPVPMQSQEMICGGRYLSSDDAMRVFAAGALANEVRIEVMWRSGKRSVVAGAKANRIYEVDEAGATSGAAESESKSVVPPIFKDVSELLNHTHHEDPYDDFVRQPLLPNRLSQTGPGVSWFDFDGDSHDDLIIGGGKGGQLAVFHNDGRGGFVRTNSPLFDAVATRDQTTILGWQKAPGQFELLVGAASYEDGLTNGLAVRRLDSTKQSASDELPDNDSSTGPLALADYDGDGDLDLFVGGRVVPGKYPAAASSRLFRNENGKFVLDETNSARLQNLGLVSGAVWSDLDGDGWPELVLACEWGPVRVFRNEKGQLIDATKALGLDQFTGWWNGVTVGDFDGDGRLDIVASNWSRNTKYQSFLAQPLRIFSGDWNRDGSVQMLEAYFDPGLNKIVPWRGLIGVANAMPWVREKFRSHAAYSTAGVEEILGERFKAAQELHVTTLDSMVFLNRGDRFEAHSLPTEVQMAPAFGVCVGDFDGDGHEDIFLGQNFFATQPETSRYDAGRGLWLRGDGRGGFEAVPGQLSGVKIYGEQRGAALGDYDGDGRVDLAVTQNGAATKLFHNERGRPGVRVRLKGTAANPQAIGAMMRLQFGERLGPARELHAGSGYWSQDSAVQVMATPEPPTQIVVRWPGGRTTSSLIPANARMISVDANGTIDESH
ncbi:MAG: VCBS repeat-containing protein [Verrucomicrobia bacterium]|nr:VCBS repeat-containing protein [Verrucomicrobiota bacterium]